MAARRRSTAEKRKLSVGDPFCFGEFFSQQFFFCDHLQGTFCLFRVDVVAQLKYVLGKYSLLRIGLIVSLELEHFCHALSGLVELVLRDPPVAVKVALTEATFHLVVDLVIV